MPADGCASASRHVSDLAAGKPKSFIRLKSLGRRKKTAAPSNQQAELGSVAFADESLLVPAADDLIAAAGCPLEGSLCLTEQLAAANITRADLKQPAQSAACAEICNMPENCTAGLLKHAIG